MFLHNFILFVTIVIINSQEVEILSNILDSANTPIKVIEADVLLMDKKVLYSYGQNKAGMRKISNKIKVIFTVSLLDQSFISSLFSKALSFTVKADKPNLQLYYESLCPDCIDFDSTQFKKVINLLHQYVDIHTYPYGNARTINHSDGTVEVICQHGSLECYGNKLHGCALDIIANATEALLFNACMIQQRSNDNSADTCGEQMNIKVDSIKECAKGKKGNDLLIHYGKESKKVGFKYVPYVLLNGVEWQEKDLFSDVCAAFKNPPEPCRQES